MALRTKPAAKVADTKAATSNAKPTSKNVIQNAVCEIGGTRYELKQYIEPDSSRNYTRFICYDTNCASTDGNITDEPIPEEMSDLFKECDQVALRSLVRVTLTNASCTLFVNRRVEQSTIARMLRKLATAIEGDDELLRNECPNLNYRNVALLLK